MSVKYIYLGKGDAFIHVPPRDLTADDIKERVEIWQEYGITEELLIGSGLYKKAETPKAGKPKKDGE
jgi:5,10-methylenetetrahydrofolate reductase